MKIISLLIRSGMSISKFFTVLTTKRFWAGPNPQANENRLSLFRQRQGSESISSQFVVPPYGRHLTTQSFDAEFETAVYKTLYLKLDNEVDKMKLAALYLQATDGTVNTVNPPEFVVTYQDEWGSWGKMTSLTKKEAREEYISEVNRLYSLQESNHKPTDER